MTDLCSAAWEWESYQILSCVIPFLLFLLEILHSQFQESSVPAGLVRWGIIPLCGKNFLPIFLSRIFRENEKQSSAAADDEFA